MSDQGEFALGTIDAIFGIGVALSNAGILTRSQLAEAYAEVIRQQEGAGATPARTHAARVLREMYAGPVLGDPARRFTVVDGGRPEDDPPTAA